MRALILIAAASPRPCRLRKQQQPAGNTADVDDSLTAENIVTNDVTAIDAVTGEDANMAADVEFHQRERPAGNASSNGSSPNAARSRPSRRRAGETGDRIQRLTRRRHQRQ